MGKRKKEGKEREDTHAPRDRGVRRTGAEGGGGEKGREVAEGERARGGGRERTDRQGGKARITGTCGRLWKIEERREKGLVSSFRFFEQYSDEEKDGGTSDSHEREDEEAAGHAGTTLETRPGRPVHFLHPATPLPSSLVHCL